MRKFLFGFIGVVSLAGTCVASTTFVTVDNTAGSPTFNQIFGINNNGVMVGIYETGAGITTAHAYSYNGSTFTSADCPAATCTGSLAWEAGGINTSGAIVGTYLALPGGLGHGFLDNAGTFSTFNVTAADCPTCLTIGASSSTFAQSINSSGAIAGFYNFTGAVGSAGYVDVGGVFTPITVAGANSIANSINDSNVVGGTLCVGGACAANPNTFGYTKNGATVSCYAAGTVGSIAGCTSFTSFGVAGATTTTVSGITAVGDVFGNYTSGGINFGYTYINGVFTTVSPLAVNASATGVRVLGVNLAGTQYVGSYTLGDGTTHGFVGTFDAVAGVPEPGTLLLTSSSILLIGFLGWKRRSARQ